MKLLIFAVLAVAVNAVTFEVNEGGTTCIRLDITGTLALTATPQEGNATTTTVAIPAVDPSAVTGSCGDEETASLATMDVNFGTNVGQWRLTFIKGDTVDMEQTFSFTPDLFFNDTAFSNATLTLGTANNMTLSSLNNSFLCNSPLSVAFSSQASDNFTYSLTQSITTLQVQAFNLGENGTFGPADPCPQDTTTAASTTNNATTAETTVVTTVEPITTTPIPPPAEANTYSVDGLNETCIVFKATIVFNNFTYTALDNNTMTKDDVFIPFTNTSGSTVSWTGNCGNANATVQTLSIKFNSNWTLALTFAKGTEDSSLLTATSSEYFIRDVQLTYSLSSDIFTNVSSADAGQERTASAMNVTLRTGSIGGSYKCDVDLTESLSDGVQFQTKDLQYKAFNDNSDTTFSSDNVSECPGDDESNSIVPIAVGAALAGLVVIVLIAYLIGRRRSRRQGYESV